MSLDLILRFARDIDIIRPETEGSYNTDGLWVPGTFPDVLTIKASVQPITGNTTLKETPKADRNEERIKIYSFDQPKVRQGAPLRQADILDIDGKLYEVVSVENWFMHNKMNIKYYRADAVTYYEAEPQPTPPEEEEEP